MRLKPNSPKTRLKSTTSTALTLLFSMDEIHLGFALTIQEGTAGFILIYGHKSVVDGIYTSLIKSFQDILKIYPPLIGLSLKKRSGIPHELLPMEIVIGCLSATNRFIIFNGIHPIRAEPLYLQDIAKYTSTMLLLRGRIFLTRTYPFPPLPNSPPLGQPSSNLNNRCPKCRLTQRFTILFRKGPFGMLPSDAQWLN